MEFKKSNLLRLVFIAVFLFGLGSSIKTVHSFKQLGQHHCSNFPIETLWRIASGTLSQKHGESYFDFDCYIRQFIRKDGLGIQQELEDQNEEEDSQQQNQDKTKQLVIDPIVVQYAQGLKKCLPESIDSVQATYAIWRFFRFLVQHDYVYEWMRAKIRATLGYEAQKPNSWMDGQNSANRLRLDKLFSNQFYEYVDKLMFKDFLFPLLTFFKQNTVIAVSGKITQSGKPILYQSLQTHNYLPKIFQPIKLQLPNTSSIFSYTIPGLPLLLGGSTQKLSWAFTGVLLDRSNIQQIQTVGNKFYHHDTQQWLKLDSQQFQIPGVAQKKCKYMHSAYGPLYTKQDSQGKTQQYIVRWHQKQSKVRIIFTDIYNLIINNGNIIPASNSNKDKSQSSSSIQFPFNSILLINQTGIFQYLCQQFYPSYFLYPDMFGQPQQIKQRWITYPSNKKYISISNKHLTTTKQQQYRKYQPLNSYQQQIGLTFRAYKQNKLTPQKLIKFISQISTTPLIKKQKQLLMKIYRKIKFFYLPLQEHRKSSDQLINILQKWDNNLNNPKIAPIYILWQYFLKQYTFNYVSGSQYGAAIIKHKIITDNYWYNQMLLWQKGTSYGQCDSNEYQNMKNQVNGTGHNSSCYLNIIRAINTTRQILQTRYQGDYSKINLYDFIGKKYFKDQKDNYKGNHVQQAFGVYYSRNVMFVGEVGNDNVIYYQGYKEEQKIVNLGERSEKNEQKEVKKDEKKQKEVNEEL